MNKTIEYYVQDIDSYIIIEELSKAEAIENVMSAIESNRQYNDGDAAFVLYNDNSMYDCGDGSENGAFKKSNIKGIIISNGSTIQVYGKYTIDELGIVDFVY